MRMFIKQFPRAFWIAFCGFVLLTIVLYVFLAVCTNKISFDKYDYVVNAHHFLPDARSTGGSSTLLRSLGQYDAQWFLKIGASGYPSTPTYTEISDKKHLNGLSYVFFPLYPFSLASVNILVHNIELSAFLITSLLLIANFFSLYWVVSSLYSVHTALRTIFLLFLYPFSIFYRSYFSESIFLLILVWFSYFFVKNKYLLAAIFLGLLTITHGISLFFIPAFFFYLVQQIVRKRLSYKKALIYGIVSCLPFSLWVGFCFLKTGNPLYFYVMEKNWAALQGIPILHNVRQLLDVHTYRTLPFHGYHGSKIDSLTVFVVCLLLVISKRFLPIKLWIVSAMLWVTPLLVKDTMSFSRLQITSFPLFMYVAEKCTGIRFVMLALLLGIGLFFVSLFFINWYWIG